jgi:uncharacterized RDD family membrane protein YckC
MAYGDGPPPNPNDDLPPNYGNVPPPGYGNVPPPGYGNLPPPGYGNVPPPGYGNVPPPGYGNVPPPGYGNVPQPGYGNVPPGYGYGGVPSANYANWGQRVGANLIDWVPIIIVLVITGATNTTAIIYLGYLICLGIWIYNRWIQAGNTGQSWGKKVLHIKLIGESTGQPIGAGMAFARDICHFLDYFACGIGFLFPLWDDKRQTFADKIVSTVVVPV